MFVEWKSRFHSHLHLRHFRLLPPHSICHKLQPFRLKWMQFTTHAHNTPESIEQKNKNRANKLDRERKNNGYKSKTKTITINIIDTFPCWGRAHFPFLAASAKSSTGKSFSGFLCLHENESNLIPSLSVSSVYVFCWEIWCRWLFFFSMFSIVGGARTNTFQARALSSTERKHYSAFFFLLFVSYFTMVRGAVAASFSAHGHPDC